jgi:hypothetical protein
VFHDGPASANADRACGAGLAAFEEVAHFPDAARARSASRYQGRKSLSRPPHRGRPKRRSASGSRPLRLEEIANPSGAGRLRETRNERASDGWCREVHFRHSAEGRNAGLGDTAGPSAQAVCGKSRFA